MCTNNNSKDSCCQSGRSMVEILAVICIIVLLSVGSLLLYSYVIAKNQANTIQTMSNERAASIMTIIRICWPVFTQSRKIPWTWFLSVPVK